MTASEEVELEETPMISHLHGKMAPFDLHDEIVYFHDWRYVFTGGLKWEDDQGNPVPLMGRPTPIRRYIPGSGTYPSA